MSDENNCFTKIFLQKYPLIEAKTIEALISNGFSSQELLLVLDLNTDLPLIATNVGINMAQTSYLKKILMLFQKSHKDFDLSIEKKISEDLNDISSSFATNLSHNLVKIEPKTSLQIPLPIQWTSDENYALIPSTSSQSLPSIPPNSVQSLSPIATSSPHKYSLIPSTSTKSLEPIPSTSSCSNNLLSIPSTSHQSLSPIPFTSRSSIGRQRLSLNTSKIKRKIKSIKGLSHKKSVKMCDKSIGSRYVLKSSILVKTEEDNQELTRESTQQKSSEDNQNLAKELTTDVNTVDNSNPNQELTQEKSDEINTNDKQKSDSINEKEISFDSTIINNSSEEPLINTSLTSNVSTDSQIMSKTSKQRKRKKNCYSKKRYISPKTAEKMKAKKAETEDLYKCLFGDCVETFDNWEQLRNHRLNHNKWAFIDANVVTETSGSIPDTDEAPVDVDALEVEPQIAVSTTDKSKDLLNDFVLSEASKRFELLKDHVLRSNKINTESITQSDPMAEEEKFKCRLNECNETFENKQQLRRHLKTKHFIRCNHRNCRKLFATQSEMDDHKEAVHQYREPLEEVQQTEERMLRNRVKEVPKSETKGILLRKSKEKLLVCDYTDCEQQFRHISALSRHKKQHRFGRLVYRCQTDGCGKTFMSVRSLNIHRSSHISVKPFRCEVGTCGKQFIRERSLKRHMFLHSGAQQQRHLDCGQSTGQSVNEKMVLRSAEKNTYERSSPRYITRSAQLSNLSIDPELQDITEKIFKCRDINCDKEFTQLAGLQVHKRTHTQDNSFMCGLCGQKFGQLSQLLCHKSSAHKPNYSFYRNNRKNSLKEHYKSRLQKLCLRKHI